MTAQKSRAYGRPSQAHDNDPIYLVDQPGTDLATAIAAAAAATLDSTWWLKFAVIHPCRVILGVVEYKAVTMERMNRQVWNALRPRVAQ